MEKENMINLEAFADGALSEQINDALEKVLENIYDVNTNSATTRKISVTIAFKPTQKRNGANVTMQVKSTLAPVIPTETSIIIDKDFKTGKILAGELKSQMPGQVLIEEIGKAEEVPNDGNKENKIIDLRKAK